MPPHLHTYIHERLSHKITSDNLYRPGGKLCILNLKLPNCHFLNLKTAATCQLMTC
uniref:Uncharacterized protein n=1 Tax=Anguilla anguilla TaxID=7936 RepID=A0A0E9WNY4_ANGAN